MSGLNFVLTCEKDKDVAFGLGSVYLKNSRYGGMQIVGFGLGRVVDVDRISTARYYSFNSETVYSSAGGKNLP
jgi:hypothetical protein